MNARILPIPLLPLRNLILALSLMLCLAIVSSEASAEEGQNLEQASNTEQLNFDEQKDKTPDRPFVADPDDQPTDWRDSWVPIRFMPEDFRIAAVHQLETIRETLSPERSISAVKWKGANYPREVYVEHEAFIVGRHFREARQIRDPSGKSVLEMRLSDEGTELFSQVTREMIGRRVAVFSVTTFIPYRRFAMR